MVGASGQASLRDDVECLICREGDVIQSCVVHLHGKGRGGAAGFALCGVVRLDDVPRATVSFAVLVGVGVDQLGAERVDFRGCAAGDDLPDGVQVNVHADFRLCVCNGSLGRCDVTKQNCNGVQLFAVLLSGFVLINRGDDFRICHEFLLLSSCWFGILHAELAVYHDKAAGF